MSLIWDGWSTLHYIMWFRRVPEDSTCESSVVFTIDVFWFLSWNRLISNFVYWKFRYIYCLVIGLFNGQFRLSENWMYEKIFAKIIFADSVQWPVCNYLLCNKKDSSHCNYITVNESKFIWHTITILTFVYNTADLFGNRWNLLSMVENNDHRVLIMSLHVTDLGWVEYVTLRYVVSAGTGRLHLRELCRVYNRCILVFKLK